MIPDRIAEIGNLLRTQDNRITDAPLFIVQEQKRTYGFDPQWANDSEIAWLDGCNDSVEATPEEHAKMEAAWQEDEEEPEGWTRTVTQATLAEHLGVSHAAVGMAETAKTGRISLGEDHLRAAAALFGCDPEYLLLARELSRASYALPNLSQSHAQTALALREAWADLPAEAVEKIRQIAGGAL